MSAAPFYDRLGAAPASFYDRDLREIFSAQQSVLIDDFTW
jgi:hypothetical protein